MVLTVEIFANGKVGKVEVQVSLLPGPDGLDEAAVTAIKQWEIRSVKRNGQLVDCCITFPVTFSLH